MRFAGGTISAAPLSFSGSSGGASAAGARRFSFTGYDVVRIVLASVLITAAILKGHELATDPSLEVAKWTDAYFWIAQGEFLLAIWLFVGLFPQVARSVTIVSFASMALVSMVNGLLGETSCGCFGKLHVSPWFSLGLDVSAVMLLFAYAPDQYLMRKQSIRRGVIAIGLVAFVEAAFLLALAQHAAGTTTLPADGSSISDAEVVLIQPREWIGRRCPLLTYLDVGERVSNGDWTVILFRSECVRCEEVISHYDLNPEMSRARSGVALVEVSHQGTMHRNTPPVRLRRDWLLGILDPTKQWFARTPVVLGMRDGIIVTVQ